MVYLVVYRRAVIRACAIAGPRKSRCGNRSEALAGTRHARGPRPPGAPRSLRGRAFAPGPAGAAQSTAQHLQYAVQRSVAVAVPLCVPQRGTVGKYDEHDVQANAHGHGTGPGLATVGSQPARSSRAPRSQVASRTQGPRPRSPRLGVLGVFHARARARARTDKRASCRAPPRHIGHRDGGRRARVLPSSSAFALPAALRRRERGPGGETSARTTAAAAAAVAAAASAVLQVPAFQAELP